MLEIGTKAAQYLAFGQYDMFTPNSQGLQVKGEGNKHTIQGP